jgi:hypothetical protein
MKRVKTMTKKKKDNQTAGYVDLILANKKPEQSAQIYSGEISPELNDLLNSIPVREENNNQIPKEEKPNMIEQICKRILEMTDEEINDNFVSIMQELMENGSAASLINNDDGKWAIGDEGEQNIPEENDPLSTHFFIAAKDFSNTIAGALRKYAEKE